MIGFILSCYTIAALCIRPFSGYLLDTFARRPLYLLAYSVFMVIFAGYMIASLLSIFIVLRILHGFAFGMVTVSGNTIVIDILPSSRRGEGIGYYGLANNTAMSFGPMTGLFMHTSFSYENDFRLLSPFLPPRLHHGLFGKDTAETADKEKNRSRWTVSFW